jgi:hypothetical protein
MVKQVVEVLGTEKVVSVGFDDVVDFVRGNALDFVNSNGAYTLTVNNLTFILTDKEVVRVIGHTIDDGNPITVQCEVTE